jgi:hypothetical protein
MHYFNKKPMDERSAPYTGVDGVCKFDNPIEFNVSTKDFYTLSTSDIIGIKKSIYQDGPGLLSFTVYSDFIRYWNLDEKVYTQSSEYITGAHGVSIIGWSDSKQAWHVKNSYGPTAGPNGDGTFWIAYSGHLNEKMIFSISNSKLENWLPQAESWLEKFRSALNYPGDFSTNVIHGWYSQPYERVEGHAAVESGNIYHNQSSQFYLEEADVERIGFSWKVSSEVDYDKLEFFIDDVQQAEISGERGWEFLWVDVPKGAKTFRWQYSKDYINSVGLDAAWVDGIRIQKLNIVPTILTPLLLD